MSRQRDEWRYKPEGPIKEKIILFLIPSAFFTLKIILGSLKDIICLLKGKASKDYYRMDGKMDAKKKILQFYLFI